MNKVFEGDGYSEPLEQDHFPWYSHSTGFNENSPEFTERNRTDAGCWSLGNRLGVMQKDNEGLQEQNFGSETRECLNLEVRTW